MALPNNAEAVSAVLIAACDPSESLSLSLTELVPQLQVAEPPQLYEILEPLVVVPGLVRALDRVDLADQVLRIIAEHANAKECVLALAEELERLCSELEQLDEDEEHATKEAGHVTQGILVLIQCYILAAPRVALRNRTAQQVWKPWLDLVQRAVQATSETPLVERSRVAETLRLTVEFLDTLSRSVVKESIAPDDQKATKTVLHAHLLTAVESTFPKLRPMLALRIYESQNPRLILRSGVGPGWEQDDTVLTAAASLSKGLLNDTSPADSSFGSLVLLAASPTTTISSGIVSKHLPVLIAYLQANHGIDALLAFLLRYLQPPASSSDNTATVTTAALPDDIVAALVPLIAPLSAAHPHPPTRLLLFRGVLKPLLQRTVPALRLTLYASLLAIDEDTAMYPQLRVSAIGLVREDVVGALRRGGTDGDLLASPKMLQMLGPLILWPNPRDLFSRQDLDVEEWVKETEPARLTEALLLYYTLIMVDVDNKTGIRDKDTLRSIDRDLLQPLREHVPKWIERLQTHDASGSDNHSHGHGHAVMALAGLETALERVDEARATL